MEHLTIANFKYGLDTRKSELTSQPGVLVTAENGHINQGGEFEKRKAFVRFALPAETYGLETTSSGLTVFGSRPSSKATTNRQRATNVATLTLGADHQFAQGDIVTITGVGGAGYNAASQTLTAVTATTISYANTGGDEAITADVGGTVTLILPTVITNAVTYQRLQHPAVTDGATYSSTYHKMTAVNWSYSFLGNAFVSATFSDSKSFLFYNGSIVNQSRNGMVLNGWSTQLAINTSLVTNMVAGFNTITGWRAIPITVANPSFLETATSYTGLVYSPASVTFSILKSQSSSGGRYGFENLGSQAAAPGTASAATFTVNGTFVPLSTYKIYAPTDPGNTIMMHLADAVYNAGGNNATATDIAAAINLSTATLGYSASAVGAVVTVSAPIPDSTTGAATLYNQGTLTVVATNDATANGNHSFADGSSTITASGQREYFMFDGTWAAGDTWTTTITPSVGSPFTLGKGRISNTSFINGIVSGSRVFLANGTQFNYSSVNDPTAWETQNTGAGFNFFTSQFGSTDTVQAFADYQGRLTVLGRRSAQVWQTNADPAQFNRVQTFPNIGTCAPFSAQSFGELDVFFLSDSGVRSIRVRDASLNGYVVDVGSAIDSIFKDVMTAALNATACSVMEPTANRYWLFYKDTIYIFSYFPSLKISAWSTYRPTYRTTFTLTITGGGVTSSLNVYLRTAGGYTVVNVPYDVNNNTTAADAVTLINAGTGSHGYVASAVNAVVTITPPDSVKNLSLLVYTTSSDSFTYTIVENNASFTPTKFTVYNGQVFCRDAAAIYAYGGNAGVTYDGSVATIELPWLDTKSPFMMKQANKVDIAKTGGWEVKCGMDPYDNNLQIVVPAVESPTGNVKTDSTFNQGSFSFEARGTHLKFKATTPSSWGNPSVMSSFCLQYNPAEEA